MPTPREGLTPAQLAAASLAALLLLFTRLPQMLLHPQFYAEDAWVWYQQAYNLGGLHALLIPQAGYMQTLPRLFTALILALPLTAAPLAMNLAGAFIDTLPVTALLSSRCRTWGPLRLRIVMAVLYLAIPNAQEIHIVLTNAMWHFAVLQMLLAFATPPRTRTARAVDLSVFLIGALSGPFCILMLPAVAFYWYRLRQRWTLLIAAIMAAGAVIQLLCIHATTRAPGMPLGATPTGLLRLLGGSVFLDSMVGVDFIHGGPYFPLPLLALATAGGILILAWGLRRAPLPLTGYAIFAIFTFAVSLRDPLITGPLPRWALLATQQNCRYWYYPSLLFLWAAVWCAFTVKPILIRTAGIAVLALFVFGAVRSWVYKPWPPATFPQDVARFNAAPPGQHVRFPIYPDTRQMDLLKHSGAR